MTDNLERFKCIIRPYAHALSNPDFVEYAVVIPFSSKEDCLQFVAETNITVIGVDDDVPAIAPLGTVGEDTATNLMREVMKDLKDTQRDETS